jgi:hypothetical protein
MLDNQRGSSFASRPIAEWKIHENNLAALILHLRRGSKSL